MTESRADVRNDPITIGERTVPPGKAARFELQFARLATGTHAPLPVAIVNGRYEGPNVWISGTIHGDELNGIEIVRRVLHRLDARSLHGAVIATPIVNVFGFLNESRYLPDRRDLNRSFPGSSRGSMAARLAKLFMEHVVAQCSVGIDFHTATNHRTNAPQIRADLDDEETKRLAHAFGAPFAIHARLRDGSLRQAATERGCHVLLYEAGQAFRFDAAAIETGVDGTLRTFAALGMMIGTTEPVEQVVEVRTTTWVRATRGGIAVLDAELGDYVERGSSIGSISDAFGMRPSRIIASRSGWVIARTLRPQVSQGDAICHIATATGPERDEPAEKRRRS